jgi:hypothetical protein
MDLFDSLPLDVLAKVTERAVELAEVLEYPRRPAVVIDRGTLRRFPPINFAARRDAAAAPPPKTGPAASDGAEPKGVVVTPEAIASACAAAAPPPKTGPATSDGAGPKSAVVTPEAVASASAAAFAETRATPADRESALMAIEAAAEKSSRGMSFPAEVILAHAIMARASRPCGGAPGPRPAPDAAPRRDSPASADGS